MKKLLILLVLFSFAGCEKEAIEESQSGNFRLELLFEKDGCKMYRFHDGGRVIYWATCPGKTEYTWQSKNMTHNEEEVTTDGMDN
jgi:hypothetical protein